jgi:myo-inositol-1(or 4)-monophosphatase
MHPMLNTAVKAARQAGRLINRASLDSDALQVTRKERNDFVTEVDRAAEDAIIETLLGAYPRHSILAEESGHRPSAGGNRDRTETLREAEHIWIIDPLDGTTNFIHGLPHYCISIALMERGVITQGLIYDPVRNELFTASRGRGAFLNDRRIRVSKRIRLEESLIGTGFPFRRIHDIDIYLKMLRPVMEKAAGIRRAGAAALDMAYTAAGRFDGFFELGLKPWDVAAGSLLVTEAGGLVGDFNGNASYMESEQIVAGTPKVFSALIPLMITPLTSLPPFAADPRRHVSAAMFAPGRRTGGSPDPSWASSSQAGSSQAGSSQAGSSQPNCSQVGSSQPGSEASSSPDGSTPSGITTEAASTPPPGRRRLTRKRPPTA